MSDYRKDFKSVQSDYYWSLPRVVLMALFGVAGLCLLGWLVQGNNFFVYKMLAPQYEAVRRDVMIESRAYGEAQTRQFYRLKLQYTQAKSDDEKATIRAMALHEAQAFDRALLPADLQAFLTSIGG